MVLDPMPCNNSEQPWLPKGYLSQSQKARHNFQWFSSFSKLEYTKLLQKSGINMSILSSLVRRINRANHSEEHKPLRNPLKSLKRRRKYENRNFRRRHQADKSAVDLWDCRRAPLHRPGTDSNGYPSRFRYYPTLTELACQRRSGLDPAAQLSRHRRFAARWGSWSEAGPAIWAGLQMGTSHV